jgi:hypothetical protein
MYSNSYSTTFNSYSFNKMVIHGRDAIKLVPPNHKRKPLG